MVHTNGTVFRMAAIQVSLNYMKTVRFLGTRIRINIRIRTERKRETEFVLCVHSNTFHFIRMIFVGTRTSTLIVIKIDNAPCQTAESPLGVRCHKLRCRLDASCGQVFVVFLVCVYHLVGAYDFRWQRSENMKA